MIRCQVGLHVLHRTFRYFRECGRGRCECQVIWLGPWSSPETVTEAVHPKHASHSAGFSVDEHWLHQFWIDLATRGQGIRLQAHTHPGRAFHSETDNSYPIIHSVGFLSLVIPNYARGPVGLDGAYLAEIQPSGRWSEVPIADRIELQ